MTTAKPRQRAYVCSRNLHSSFDAKTSPVSGSFCYSGGLAANRLLKAGRKCAGIEGNSYSAFITITLRKAKIEGRNSEEGLPEDPQENPLSPLFATRNDESGVDIGGRRGWWSTLVVRSQAESSWPRLHPWNHGGTDVEQWNCSARGVHHRVKRP